MSDNLLDLITTPVVVVAIFVAAVVFVSLSLAIARLVVRWLVSRCQDAPRRHQQRQAWQSFQMEREQREADLLARAESDAKSGTLEEFYDSYAAPAEAKGHMDTVIRGASVPQTNDVLLPVGFYAHAAEYGFDVVVDRQNDTLVLFDTDFATADSRRLDVERRMYKSSLSAARDRDPIKVLAHARKRVNERAKAAGMAPVARKRGRRPQLDGQTPAKNRKAAVAA